MNLESRNFQRKNGQPAQRSGRVINFFTGGWFERYVYLNVASLLHQSNLEFTCIKNAQVSLSNEYDFELDLLFLIDGHPLWVECKTGDHNTYIPRLLDIRRMLSIAPRRSILVVLNVSDSLAEQLSHLHEINVANQSNFLNVIQASLGMTASLPYQTSSKSMIYSTTGLQTFLKKFGLRPLPESRMQVINCLINTVSALEQPQALNEIKLLLAAKLSKPRSQLQDILTAIMRGGCFLDEAGQPIFSAMSPISKLSSSDPNSMESRCLAVYIRAVLDEDPEYFSNFNNLLTFQKVVGTSISDSQIAEAKEAQSSGLLYDETESFEKDE